MASALLAASLFLASGLAAQAKAYDATGLNFAPGATASELNFAWFSSSAAKKPVVQIAKKVDQKGDAFPAAKAKSFTGAASKVVATQFNADDKTIALDSYAEKVTVTGLVDSTDYVYRVGDGKVWSDAYAVSTRDQKSFGFLVVGDPQLGAKSTGPKTLDSDAAGWKDTLAKATSANPKASFLVSLGDEVNDYNKLSTQDAEYAAYFAPAQLRSLPVATVNGNHDFQMGEYYGYHYNQPNVSAQYGTSYGNDGDYWFVYGDALFLALNSNTQSIATHDVFIRDAVAKNPNAKWRIACMHHSVYSEADHFADPDVIDRRANFPPIFERYKIDVVLQGHDHSYTRTLPMLKGKPVEGFDAKADSITNPTGIIYFTFNSGSGSKFYDWHDAAPEVFSAVRWQGKVPSFSSVSVDAGTFSVKTYRTDDLSLIDSFSIIKK
jgi:predicted phosphodiesterase